MTWFGDLTQDAAFALRVLRREWRASLLAALCLAIGIGATTTMFNVTETLLIRALPFGHGDRLFAIMTKTSGGGAVGVGSYEDYLDWQRRERSFAELAAYGPTPMPVQSTRPIHTSAALVSANFFQALGVSPLRGRAFASGEDDIGAPPVAVVSSGFADRELGGVDNAVGRVIDVRGIPRAVVGVVPDGQVLPVGGELWLPLGRELHRGRNNRNLNLIGWLAPGATPLGAQREMSALSAEMSRVNPVEDRGLDVSIVPLRDRFVGSARAALAIMSLATLLVLLVACANVAGIQLTRATARTHEIAIRSALGGNRSRLLRQLMTESIMLSLAGGCAGIFIAYLASDFAESSLLGPLASWLAPSLDVRVLGFAFGISVVTGILFGIAPAWRLVLTPNLAALRQGRGQVGSGRAALQKTFVVMQIALSVILLVAAGLSIESVRRLQQVPLGFDSRGVLLFEVTLQGTRYDDHPAERLIFSDALVRRLSSLPSVSAAGATSLPPLRCCSLWQLHIDGRPAGETDALHVTGNMVTPGYFEAMRIPLLHGRLVAATDGATSTPVMIVSETFASRYWPDSNAIGRRVQDGNDHAVIVGVVRDVKQGGLLDAPEPQFYRPLAQKPNTTLTFAVRTSGGDPTTLTPAVRRAVRDLDPGLAIYSVGSLQARVDDALSSRRTFEALMIVFGAIALSLAAMGMFAVASFVVEQRRRELGLRVALGADPALLFVHELRGGAVLAGAGSVLGFAGAVAVARLLSHSLYGVRGGDAVVYLVAVGLLAIVTVLATYGPARRASGADPIMSLRAD